MKVINVFIIVIFLMGCFSAEPEKTGLEGKVIPEFSLLLTDSVTWFNSRSIPVGKAIAIFYFSPYCPYCRAQTKEITEDMDRLKDIQFYFVASFQPTELRRFYDDYHLSKYPNITIGVDTGHFLSDYFEVAGVPYMAIYGADKKLNKTFMGKIYSSQIKKVAKE